MSIQTDQMLKDLQEKVAWLEREVTDLKHANAELRGLFDTPKVGNGTLSLKRKV